MQHLQLLIGLPQSWFSELLIGHSPLLPLLYAVASPGSSTELFNHHLSASTDSPAALIATTATTAIMSLLRKDEETKHIMLTFSAPFNGGYQYLSILSCV